MSSSSVIKFKLRQTLRQRKEGRYYRVTTFDSKLYFLPATQHYFIAHPKYGIIIDYCRTWNREDIEDLTPLQVKSMALIYGTFK